MRIKQKKVTKKRISTHMSLLLLSLVIFVVIISFVIYSNNRNISTTNVETSTTSSVEGDILSEAVSTYEPGGSENSKTQDENNIMNDNPVVNNKFIAKDGDSLAVLTREYIKEYIVKNNLELTKVQRMYVEGVYISNRSYPRLNIGQNVEIDQNEIVTLITKSRSMSAGVEALWAPYARNIT